MSVGVVLDAIFTTNEFRAFALRVVLEMRATRNTFVLVALLMRLLLTHVDLLADGVVKLSGLQRIGRDNLNLPQVLTTLGYQLLSLNELSGILRNHRDGFTVRVILIVSSLVLIEQRQMREDLTADVALEADVGDCVLKSGKINSMNFQLRGTFTKLTVMFGLLITICPFCPPS